MISASFILCASTDESLKPTLCMLTAVDAHLQYLARCECINNEVLITEQGSEVVYSIWLFKLFSSNLYIYIFLLDMMSYFICKAVEPRLSVLEDNQLTAPPKPLASCSLFILPSDWCDMLCKIYWTSTIAFQEKPKVVQKSVLRITI